MKAKFFVLACLAVMLNFASAADEPIIYKCACAEPTGFRGIPWGQIISDTRNLKSIGPLNFSSYGDVFDNIGHHPAFYYLKEWSGEGYVRDRDDLKIGYADVNEIVYLFRERRFYGVVMETVGNDNRNELHKAVNAWMGNPTAELNIGGNYVVIWEGSKVRAVLDYKKSIVASRRDVRLYIISKEMEARFIGF